MREGYGWRRNKQHSQKEPANLRIATVHIVLLFPIPYCPLTHLSPVIANPMIAPVPVNIKKVKLAPEIRKSCYVLPY